MTKTELLKIAKSILFNTEMVRAIRDNRKTQTRRFVKIKDQSLDFLGFFDADKKRSGLAGFGHKYCIKELMLPRYNPGEILYVRETWQRAWHITQGEIFNYRADTNNADGKWRPSIHMPKEAARIFLEVTDVRIERLQDISEAGAEAEGLVARHERSCDGVSARIAFAEMWDSTIKPTDAEKYGWNANPWVEVYTFKNITQ